MRKAIKHETETIKGEMTQVIYCKERIKNRVSDAVQINWFDLNAK
ncbi:hypothetical protein SB359474_1436 [Shigella boydii 3594-74]|uniref:Uncharacterized protein n=3 Tax=Shigella TaxID=620 RepID=A0A6N3QMY7_SHIFL|nr:hypothetical protein SGF_03992 [Shigella flexneri CDC 796-83]EGJ01433.1 hypothetical protein SB359474_1436 [Shigella boydii 3594-74]EIQ12483.1 hypothetical protein SFCCH060_1581 [Shigella flexneri CCH060]EIQ39371.1 hypothetical protein SB444474_1899 [Shigella boydii 4444-74]